MIYMAWTASATVANDFVWYSQLDESNGWSPATPFTEAHSSHSPSLTNLFGTPHLAWNVADGALLWSRLSDSGWSAPEIVAGAVSNTSVALASNRLGLYAAWKGLRDTVLHVSRFDGQVWTSLGAPDGVHTNTKPALAGRGGFLYMAWREVSSDALWWASFDGNSWSAARKFADRSSNNTPALLASVLGLSMAWTAPDLNGNPAIWWSQFTNDFASMDDSGWSEPAPIGDRASSDSPALVADGEQIYMAWKGLDDESLNWSRFDGISWTPPLPLVDGRSSAGPALG